MTGGSNRLLGLVGLDDGLNAVLPSFELKSCVQVDRESLRQVRVLSIRVPDFEA